MNKNLLVSSFLALGLSATTALAKPPRYPVQPVEAAPVIDGKLDDACWSNLPPAGPFVDKNSKAVTQQTTLRFGYDKQNLYIAARLEEPEMDKVKGNPARFCSPSSTATSSTCPRPPSAAAAVGIYSITHPEEAERLGRRKVEKILSTKADCVAVANPGCHLQIQRGLQAAGASVKVRHPVSILAESCRQSATKAEVATP